jgi:hypothetical protein
MLTTRLVGFACLASGPDCSCETLSPTLTREYSYLDQSASNPRLKSRKIFEYQSWAKAMAILNRSNERLNHLSIDKVAVELV